jgi:O-antigen ligase
MAGAMFASVVAGASRAGSILVTVEILVVVFLGLSPRLLSAGTLSRALSWTALFAVVFAAVVGWEVLWSRFQDPDPFRGRRELLLSSLAMVREQPWTGFGLGTWPAVYPAYAVTDFGAGLFANHAHNDWAEWAAEGGVPFLLMLLAVAAWSLHRAIRFPWGLGVVSAFFHCLVDFPMQRPALAALVFALMGALAAAKSASARRKSQIEQDAHLRVSA